jgi:O-antigen ligase
MPETRNNYTRFYEIYLGVFALFVLVAPKIIALFFVGFIPLIIVGMAKKELRFKLTLLPALFMLLYLGYLIYSLATRHPDLAGRYIENKLSFILLPLLLSFRLKGGISFRPLAIGFLFGTAFLLIESFYGSIATYSVKHDYHSFLSSEFSKRHHPSYMAVYYITAIAFIWYGYRKHWKGFTNVWLVLGVTLLLAVAYGLCLSLAGILYGFGALGVVFLVFIYRKFGKWATIGATIATPALIYLAITGIPQFQGEWTNAKQYADEYAKDPKAFVRNKHYPMSGTEVRLVMWSVSSQVTMDYPMGVGTGNVDEVLTTYLNRLDQQELAKMEYNPHNQYLQTAIELGWVGLILLLAILFTGCRIALKNRNTVLLLVVTNLAFNMLFESMLQRQSGIVFYTFIICLLAIYATHRKQIAL